MTCCDKAKMEAIRVMLIEDRVFLEKICKLAARIHEESQNVMNRQLYAGCATMKVVDVVDILLSLADDTLDISRAIIDKRYERIKEMKKLADG